MRTNGWVPENDDESWNNVPIVNRNLDTGKVNLNANWRSNDNSDYAVSSLRESLRHKDRHKPAVFVILSPERLAPPAEHLARMVQFRLNGLVLFLCEALAVFCEPDQEF